MSKKITKRDVDALPPNAALWDQGDGAIKGFGVRRQKSDDRIYVLKTRVGGRQRWLTIGRHGSPWTVEMARKEARRLLTEITQGEDVATVRDQRRADITVADLCDRYLEAAGRGEILTRFGETKKPSTLATDKGRVARHVKPLLGRRKVLDVTPDDIQRFVRDVAAGKTKADVKTGKHGRAIVRGGKGTATRTVGLLGGIFAYAVAKNLRPDNPVRAIRRYKGRTHERFLSPDELARLGTALAAEPNATAAAAIRLLLFTGCRKSEILNLRWEHVDLALGLLRLPTSKTGARTVHLAAPALDVLASLLRDPDNPYVLPGDRPGAPLVNLSRPWRRVRKAAKLDDVRLHDLRHAFASIGASGGDSLYIVGALLGHRDTKTTARYAHLADNAVKAAADRIAGRIASAMTGPAAEVVPLKRQQG